MMSEKVDSDIGNNKGKQTTWHLILFKERKILMKSMMSIISLFDVHKGIYNIHSCSMYPYISILTDVMSQILKRLGLNNLLASKE